MRKFNFIFGVLAVASAGLMTSCDWSDDDDKDLAPNVTVPSLDGKTLIVNTNEKATIKLQDGSSQSGTKSAKFDVSGNTATATVTVSAAGYLTQTVEVTFGENSVLSVDVNLVKASSITKTQEEAKGSSVSNDFENVQASGVNASIGVPQNVEISGSTGDFSIVAYVPAEADRSDLKKNDNVELPVLALNCTPDGADFSQSVTLTATTDDAKGCEVLCVSDKEGEAPIIATVDPNGTSVSAKVGHFSVWRFVLKATLRDVTTKEEVIKSGSMLLAKGNNTISYTQKYGFESKVQNGGLIANFLVNQFGKAGSISKSVNITSDKVGSAEYTVKQATKTYTFESGNRRFTATVYGAVTVTIDRTTSDTSGHSGGGGK